MAYVDALSPVMVNETLESIGGMERQCPKWGDENGQVEQPPHGSGL